MSQPRAWTQSLAPLARWVTPEARDFDDYARLLTLRFGRALSVLFIVSLLVFWVSDYFVFADSRTRDLMRSWRVALIVCSALAWVVLRALERHRHVAYLVVCTFALAGAALNGMTLAKVDAIANTGFVYGTYINPLATLPLLLSLRPRILLCLGLPIVYAAVYAWVEPNASSAAVIVSVGTTAVFTAIASILGGHLAYLLVRSNYHQRAELALRAKELESRVAARTARLRELARHLDTTREQERTRVARELHDETSQMLTAMRLELAALGSRGEDDAALRSALERLTALVDDTQIAAKRLIRSLRPIRLQELGIVEAVRKLATEGSSRVDFRIGCDVTIDDADLDEATSVTAYRAIQEALTNATRHAEASRVDVSIRRTDDRVHVTVADDGSGFDPDAITEGFGLMGMRERIEASGGSVTIESGPEAGSTVFVDLPARSVDADTHS